MFLVLHVTAFAALTHGLWRHRMKILASRFALLALALSAASFAPAAFSQDQGSDQGSAQQSDGASHQHGAPDPQKQAARLTKRLGLTDDQTTKITTILQNQQQQISTVRSDSSLSKDDRHSKMQSIRQDTDTQINGVLTPDQQTKYAQMKQEMMQRMQNKGSGGGSSGG
jgi:periplasmic protein CpxP/Spy